MTKFEQLRVDVTNRVKAEKQYWDSLHEVAKNFGPEFSKYLELESNEALDSNGDPVAIIRTGRNNNGEFEQCAYWQLDRQGRELSFILFLRLPGKNSMHTEVSLSVKIALSKPDIYGTSLNIKTGSMLYDVTCEEINGQLNLFPFFDALYEELQNKINVQSL